MRRLLVTLFSAGALFVAFSTPASAGDVKVRDSGSPDSGTCGNNWANDTFTREFDVQQNDGTFALTEFFKDGHFVTVPGASPGGCQAWTDHGQLVGGGIRGSFHGFLSGTVTGGTYNPDATCPDPCNGTTFVAAFFGPDATWNVVNDWSFTYEAQGGGLLFRRWVNAGSGNEGDIATA
ncbi:MAG TPA: hypothetical protein VJT78_14035 [Candidatus Dormibacteraeota bacterium]|nr:hypothetical protein [Candidatus Dormibacteraeota bacterium]